MQDRIGNLDEVIALSPRDRIYSTIAKNPGLHFREVQRRTSIATGALQYHIDCLKKKRLIREEKEGKFSRFYSLGGGEINSVLMNLLRQTSVRRIILFLMKRRRAPLPQIAGGVGLSVSTASFHLQKLLQAQVVVQKNYGKKTYFFLSDKDAVLEILLSYKGSFLDELVDNFTELWEEELVR
ncbi:MAG: winged helix-turn-helix transcriptional regulator [archaeon]|jgi:predicted transcriptional regulator